MGNELYNKYRPDDLDLIIHHEEIVNSLKNLFEENKIPNVFCFTGKSGSGKTSLAFIISKMLGCDENNVIYTNGALDTSKEDIEKIIKDSKYKPLGESKNKCYIIDECHRLTLQAREALLQKLEFPPSHCYFILCTTDASKIIETLGSRCAKYTLSPIPTNKVLSVLLYVAEEENIKLDKNSLRLIASESGGNLREALSNLGITRYCKNKNEVASLLNSTEENNDVYNLCRVLVSKNPSWEKAITLLNSIKKLDAESCRIQIVGYLSSCVLNSKNKDKALSFCNLLENFSEPYDRVTGRANLILDVANSIL